MAFILLDSIGETSLNCWKTILVSSYGKKVDLLHSLAAMLDGWNGHCSAESEDYTNHRPDLDHWWETICLTVDYEYGFERFRFFIVISSVLGYF